MVLVAERGCHWQAIKLLRRTIEWAKERGCLRWFLSSDTNYDFAALARRVGAQYGAMRHCLVLTEA